MNRRVLITRSLPGAEATAREIIARGWTPVIEPLFSLERLRPTLPDFDALAFTSANGVRTFADLSGRRDPNVWCVGARTATIAREAGFSNVISADGDVADLVRLIDSRLSRADRLLHVGNEDARGDLAGSLQTLGFNATFVAAYRAVAIDQPGGELGRLLAGDGSLDAVLIHSPKAGAILWALAANRPERSPLNIAAISRQSVLKVSSLANDIEIAVRPDEDALMAAVERLLSRT